MESLKSGLRSILSPDLYQSLRTTRDAVNRVRDLPGLLIHPWMRDSRIRLKEYQDKYRSERCFVIGNGPSLKQTDLSLLRDEFTFGMNRIYLAYEEWGFRNSFLVAVNNLVIEQCRDDYQELNLPKFFAWRSRNLLYPTGKPDQYTHFLDTTYTMPKFATRLDSRFWEGATVTYVCLQLAFCMGFKEVYLIGVDHDFVTKGPANQTIVSTGDDPNHFSPAYFGAGFRWQLPDLETSEQAYRLAGEAFQAAGRKVLDATIGGKLTVFPKVDFNRLFK